MKIALAALLALTPVSALAGEYQQGYSTSRNCFKTEYREEYIPGNADNPGYVQSFHETIEVPCTSNADSLRTGGYTRKTTIEFDNNDCTDGKIAGGLVGGGVGAALSRGDGRWWAIPLGAVLGSRIGCEMEGG
jgi:hypothetical protein|tara:strand:+ start:2423 stop:2821 length:399 start_codon:yes stop_codon:yes gene_type:complete